MINVYGSATVVVGLTGTYTGNDSVDRDIPHGLGHLPKFVFITVRGSTSKQFCLTEQAPTSLMLFGGIATTVQTMDATTFSVGDAASYPNSANATGLTYDWIAF